MTFAPPGPLDLAGSAVLAVLFGAVFGAAELLWHRFHIAAEVSRKVVHAGGGLVVLLVPHLLRSVWTALALAAVFALLRQAAVAIGGCGAYFTTVTRDDSTFASYRSLLACDPLWAIEYARNGWCANDPWLLYASRHSAPARASEIVPSDTRQQAVVDAATAHGFASALILLMVALGIAFASIMRLANPVEVAFGEATIVAVIGLAVNIASAFLLSGSPGHDHAHGHDDHGHHHGHGHDNNMRAAYFHVLADALTSVLAIVALLAGRYLGWVWLDPVMGIVGAIVISRWSWTLVRDTSAVLLDTADTHLIAEIRECVEGPGDAQISDLHVWRVGPQAHAAIVSVAGSPTRAIIRERLKPVHEIAHLTVEMCGTDDARANSRDEVARCV